MRSHLLVLLLVIACDSKSKDSPTPAPDPVKPAVVPKLTCDKGIPPAIKAKYFAKAEPEFGEPFAGPDGMLTSCRFQEKEPDRRTLISFRCGETFANLEEYLRLIESQVAVKYERFPTPGRGAYASKSTFGVLHRSLPCVIEVEPIRGDAPVDMRALATDIEAALN